MSLLRCSGETFSIGVTMFNQACIDADFRIVEVLCAAMGLWRAMLPEVVTAAGACLVGNAAARLWGVRSVEPAPPRTIENHDGRTPLKAKMKQRETELRAAFEPDPPPPRLPLPQGAPISLRGLAILRQQETRDNRSVVKMSNSKKEALSWSGIVESVGLRG